MVYETKRSEEASNRIDYNLFWGLLILAFGFWVVMLVLNIFSVSNLMIIAIPLVLLGTNLYCFYNCSKKQQENVRVFVNNQTQNAK